MYRISHGVVFMLIVCYLYLLYLCNADLRHSVAGLKQFKMKSVVNLLRVVTSILVSFLVLAVLSGDPIISAVVVITFAVMTSVLGDVLPKSSFGVRVIMSGFGITQMSGKIGGHVVAKGKGATYIRIKTKPHNPNTTSQASKRAQLRALSQQWRTLTVTQINSWNAAAINFPRKNKQGTTIILSGSDLFISLNLNLFNIGATTITSPPTPTTVLTPGGVAVTYAATVITATWTTGVVPVSTAFECWATPGLSPGKSFIKSQFRLVTSFPAATVSGAGVAIFTTPYAARFGQAAVGTKVQMYLVAVGTLTGLKSKSNTSSVIVS